MLRALLSISDLAKLAGVSVRTLHHYDDIGLLPPAKIGANLYRQYGQAEKDRLAQILLFRACGVPLSLIAEILAKPDAIKHEILQEHRLTLLKRAEDLTQIIGTLDQFIAQTKEARMTKIEPYKFAPIEEKQEEYEAWLLAKYGPNVGADIAHAKKALAKMDDAQKAAHVALLEEIEKDLIEVMVRQLPPQSYSLDSVIERHRNWVAVSWGKDCPPMAYANLVHAYQHPDFIARYEGLAEGFSAYLCAAMESWAARQN